MLQPVVQAANLSLAKLDADSSGLLVKAVTGGLGLPEEMLNEIIRKTSGIPLFLEELTKTILDSDALRLEADNYVLKKPKSFRSGWWKP